MIVLTFPIIMIKFIIVMLLAMVVIVITHVSITSNKNNITNIILVWYDDRPSSSTTVAAAPAIAPTAIVRRWRCWPSTTSTANNGIIAPVIDGIIAIGPASSDTAIVEIVSWERERRFGMMPASEVAAVKTRRTTAAAVLLLMGMKIHHRLSIFPAQHPTPLIASSFVVIASSFLCLAPRLLFISLPSSCGAVASCQHKKNVRSN